MTRDEITRMAQEAGFVGFDGDNGSLRRFAALVAAAERESILKDGWRQCAKDQRTTQFCGMVEQAVLAEREACAKRLDAVGCDHCAANIRARGQA